MQPQRFKHSLEEIEKWAEYYNNDHTLTETSEHFNVPYKTIANLLIKLGYKKPSRQVTKIRRLNAENIPYFKDIDSHEKAYFLGLLFSDGYICTKTSSKVTGIAVQLQDEYIIKYLYSALQLKTKLNYYKNSVKLYVTNKGMYEDLVSHGMIENKSHSEYHFPQIPKEFYNSFILGYFDGDGCITIKSSGAIVVSICGNSKTFLGELQKVLKDEFQIESRLNQEMKPSGNYLYVLYLRGRKNQLKFKDIMYKDSPIFLTRKHDKFMKIPC